MLDLNLFSQRLKHCLELRKITNGRLANYIGQTSGSITRYLKGERIPSNSVIIKMAYFLKINPNYLSGISDDITCPADIKTKYINECNSHNNASIFSIRLKLLINESKKMHKEIASDLNVSKGVISNYINDRREPDYNTLKKICNYFNVSADYLLGMDSYKNKEEKNDLKNKLINILMESGILDIISENNNNKKLFLKILKDSCETIKMVQKYYK